VGLVVSWLCLLADVLKGYLLLSKDAHSYSSGITGV